MITTALAQTVGNESQLPRQTVCFNGYTVVGRNNMVKMKRPLQSYLSWNALGHLKFVPRAMTVFESPVTLLKSYIGFFPETCHYRTRAGQCFFSVAPVESESIFCSFVKREYGDIEQAGDVIDIGANIGAFSLYAASSPKTKRVFAFEPVPETFARLIKNVKASTSGERIVCVNSAVSSCSGFTEMIPGDNSMLHMIIGSDLNTSQPRHLGACDLAGVNF